MRALLAAALALPTVVVIALNARAPVDAAPDTTAPKKAAAGLVWRSGGMVLLLTDVPCPFEEFRDELESEGIPPARAYVVTQAGRAVTGCWAADIGGDVMTRRLDGEPGTIPLAWFRHGPDT